MITYAHPDIKHKFIISAEQLHYDKGERYVLQQINEDRSIHAKEVALTSDEWAKMQEQLELQGWKQLLVE